MSAGRQPIVDSEAVRRLLARLCEHGVARRTCPICAPIEAPLGLGLWQFDTRPMPPPDVASQLRWGAEYIRRKAPEWLAAEWDAQNATAAWYGSPRIFGEFARWKRPWWARAIAWAIAAWYAVCSWG